MPSFFPKPGTREWEAVVTASKVPAIVGVSPYTSTYTAWHEMKGLVERAPIDKKLALRGHLMEPLLMGMFNANHEVQWVNKQVTRKLPVHFGIPGAFTTLDALVRLGDELAIVEFKSAQRRDAWGEPGTNEIPDHVGAQVLFQLLCVPKAVRAYVCVEFSNFDYQEYVVERNDVDVALEALSERVKVFWDSLAADAPPDLDSHVSTLKTLRAQHPDIAKGVTAICSYGDGAAYLEAKANQKSAEAALRAASAPILAAVGNAQFLVDEHGNQIARRQAGARGSVSLLAAN